MRILIISNYYPPYEMGGWPQLTFDIVAGLTDRGHQVLVLTSKHNRELNTIPEPGIHRILHLQSPDHQYYHAYYSLLSRFHDRQNTKHIAQSCDRFSPDIIFIHGLWNMSHYVPFETEKIMPGKVVYYMANTWPTDQDVHSRYWSHLVKKSLLRYLKYFIGKFVKKVILSKPVTKNLKFTHVLCVSKFIQQYMVNQVGVPFQQTRVVFNGIDPKIFAPSQNVVKNNRLELLYAGGLMEHKGVTTAIKGLGYLINKMGIQNIHLSLVGSGHPSYIKKLHDLISDFRIEQYVSFKERVSRAQMPELLNTYHVLLFPSTGPEALPRIVQEAMACELLVIGSSAGGTIEILQDDRNGLVFDPGNYQMMAEKIALVANNPDLQQRLGKNARKTVEEEFTIDIMVNKIEDYFSSVLISTN